MRHFYSRLRVGKLRLREVIRLAGYVKEPGFEPEPVSFHLCFSHPLPTAASPDRGWPPSVGLGPEWSSLKKSSKLPPVTADTTPTAT